MSALERLRAGTASQAEISEIENSFRIADCAAIERYIVPFFKTVRNLDIDLLVSVAQRCRTPYIVSEVINGIRYRGLRSQSFLNLLKEVFSDQFEDYDYDILMAALYAMSDYAESETQIKPILKEHLASPSAVIRDVVVEVAQIYLGVPYQSRLQTKGDGNLISRVEPRIRNWLLS